MKFFLGIQTVHAVRYSIGYSPTFLIAFIENLFLNKIQFNRGILRSWVIAHATFCA